MEVIQNLKQNDVIQGSIKGNVMIINPNVARRRQKPRASLVLHLTFALVSFSFKLRLAIRDSSERSSLSLSLGESLLSRLHVMFPREQDL